MISVKLNMRAISSPRPRVLKSGITYMPKSYTQYKDYIASKFKGFKSFGKLPLVMELLMVFKTPLKVKNNKYSMPVGDVDNLYKSIADSLEGVVYENDRQIVETKIKKMYGEFDCIFINIKEYVEDKT